jgi:hypothetical protein
MDTFVVCVAAVDVDVYMTAPHKATPERLSTLSDGIFAVLTTVLVLDLHAPAFPSLKALLLVWPTWVSYAVSYLFIAIVWTNHHYLMRYATEANSRLLWLNFGHLFSMSPASAFHLLDGRQRTRAAARRLLCRSFLPCECNLDLFDLGTYRRECDVALAT